jgi:hypothetical protein
MSFIIKKLFIFIAGFILAFGATAQVRVIDNKGTIREIDSSKWVLKNNNIYNKNSLNVGIGNVAPTNTLHITPAVGASPLRVENLIDGAAIDNVVVTDATGVFKKVSQSSVAVEPWQKSGSTNKATANTDNIYQMGNVGIGTDNPAFTIPTHNGPTIPTLGVDGRVNATNYTTIVQPSFTANTINWDLSKGAVAKWTLANGANTLNLSNVKAGMYGTIILTTGTNSTLAFGAGTATNKVIYGVNGVPIITNTSGAVDILTFLYDGSTFWWTVGNNYN